MKNTGPALLPKDRRAIADMVRIVSRNTWAPHFSGLIKFAMKPVAEISDMQAEQIYSYCQEQANISSGRERRLVSDREIVTNLIAKFTKKD